MTSATMLVVKDLNITNADDQNVADFFFDSFLWIPWTHFSL